MSFMPGMNLFLLFICFLFSVFKGMVFIKVKSVTSSYISEIYCLLSPRASGEIFLERDVLLGRRKTSAYALQSILRKIICNGNFSCK